jgi:glycosyltransferase involved in cell wall biosynthesis
MDSNKKLTIAVGIPTANNEDTIRETLESLLRQTVQPDRIIIIDASTDSTPNIVRSVNKNTSVPIEIHQQSTRGQGVGGARQDIYDLLEEDILACLDTQKKVGSRWIETRLQFHRGNPEYDILSGMRSTESVDRPATGPKDTNFLRQSNCSIRKSALDRVEGWDPWMARGEDWDLRIRLWTSGAQAYIKSDLGCEFIEHDDSRSAFGKILSRPSSADFLRKYGLWYAQFHPIHSLGDIASLGSCFLVLFAALGITQSLLALSLLIGPLAGSLIYLWLKAFRSGDDVSDLKPLHAVIAVRFFLLGYTFARKLIFSTNHDWNYGGFNRVETGK